MNQYEARDGDNTKGTYSVVLPDGRRQTVDYYVNGYSGYVADVKYEGEAQFPEEPAYKAPPPAYAPAPAYRPAA